MLDLVADGDTVSVVTFGSRAKVIVPSAVITKESRQKAKNALRDVTAEGTTDMAGGIGAGLRAGSRAARRDARRHPAHRVVVGDGVPNDPAQVLGLADAAKEEHVPITALGLGNDFDETLMTGPRAADVGHVPLRGRCGPRCRGVQGTRSRAWIAWWSPARRDSTSRRGPGVTINEVIGIPECGVTGARTQPTSEDLTEGQTRDVFVRVTAKGRQDGKSNGARRRPRELHADRRR